MKTYTLYSWTTKPGCAKQFDDAWKDSARWAVKQKGSSRSTRLFIDSKDPDHFMSVDSWEDEDALQNSRTATDFGRLMRNLRKPLNSFSYWDLKLESEEHG